MDQLADAIIDAILSAPLSDVSKNNYVASIRRLIKASHNPLTWILTHPVEAVAMWGSKPDKPDTSMRSYVTVILTCFKFGTHVIPANVASYRPQWMEFFDQFDARIRYKYGHRIASKRQLQSYLPWDTILQKRDALDKNSDAYLILCMYTMIEPARADYNCLRIFIGPPTQAQTDDYPNHLIVAAEARFVRSLTLVLNEFKSSKSRHEYRRTLPPQLQRVIVQSLKRTPRNFLIVSPRTGKPYLDPHAYTVYVDRIFSNILGKHVSINTLRHSFINHLDLNNMSPFDLEQTARNMMHNLRTMLRYRLNIPSRVSHDAINLNLSKNF